MLSYVILPTILQVSYIFIPISQMRKLICVWRGWGWCVDCFRLKLDFFSPGKYPPGGPIPLHKKCKSGLGQRPERLFLYRQDPHIPGIPSNRCPGQESIDEEICSLAADVRPLRSPLFGLSLNSGVIFSSSSMSVSC